MQIVQLFVPPNGVHVREQPLAGTEAISLQCEPLPFGQGMDHLSFRVSPRDGEADRPFHTVQIVVETGARFYEYGRGNSPQVQGAAQVHLKAVLDEFNGPLHLIDGQRGPIPLGDKYLTHAASSLGKSISVNIIYDLPLCQPENGGGLRLFRGRGTMPLSFLRKEEQDVGRL